MSAKSKYYVTFFNTPFDSLEDAKWNVEITFTKKEAKKYFTNAHEMIYHAIGDRLLSQTPIKVDEHGNISFGRTCKVI